MACNVAAQPLLSPQANGLDARPHAPSLDQNHKEAGSPSSKTVDDHINSPVGSRLRSMGSDTSYNLVEEDDYEDIHIEPLSTQRRKPFDMPLPNNLEAPSPLPTDADIPMRSASISQSLHLKHPTPDLQSLQGAYVRNVERLEESAERLSVTSSLEEELKKMKYEQRRLERLSSAPNRGQSPTAVPLRHVSTSSVSNSIIGVNNTARSGAYSPAGYITSPAGSLLSGSWSQPSNQAIPVSQNSRFTCHLNETALRAKLVKVNSVPAVNALSSSQSSPQAHQQESCAHNPLDEQADEPGPEPEPGSDSVKRPSLSTSNDTYRQATDLFEDFDGMHFTSHLQLSRSHEGSLTRHVSLSQPPLATDPTSFREPPTGERIVYYPAPVPMMLNLPQKLSKLPSAEERERRRLKGMSGISPEMRKSAVWLDEDDIPPFSPAKTDAQNLASLPPQLRASAFFDHPTAAQFVEVKSASAVATLDSILDASTHAPVSAFTDHPVVGHLGEEVYGRAKVPKESIDLEQKRKRRSSVSDMLRTSAGMLNGGKLVREGSYTAQSRKSLGRMSSGEPKPLNTEGTTTYEGAIPLDRSSQELELAADDSAAAGGYEVEKDREGKGEAEREKDETEEEDDGNYGGPPTTLLAELQMRKAQQKLRNRTAANAFPNGMHSTLLELDAVAQLQQRSRKQKHITLAWEDQDVADRQNFDDDDVPLGLLMRNAHIEVDRPVGLMEKREMEDNEPLSRRRARLKGDAPVVRDHKLASQSRANSTLNLEIPSLIESPLAEQEGETLAQRVRRLKAEKERLGMDFADEVLPELGLSNENTPSRAAVVEETLGQRRSRLRAVAHTDDQSLNYNIPQKAPFLLSKPRHSLADIPTAHPAAGAFQSSSGIGASNFQNAIPQLDVPHENGSGSLSMYQQQRLMKTGMPPLPDYKPAVPYGAFGYSAPMMYSPAMGVQMGNYGPHAVPMYVQDPMMGPPLDPKQRDMIDRWRQSVVR